MEGIYVIHSEFATPPRRGVADFSVDPVAEFTADARRIGLVLDHAVDDDRIHRVPVEGKGPRNTSGSYKLFVADDGFAYGWAKNWPTGENVEFCNKSPSPERNAEWADRRQAAAAKAEREREQEKAEKLAESMREFHEAGRCTSHPYFTEKGVPVPADARINDKGSALIPVYHNGKPVGFERILAKKPDDGPRKRHCSGGLGAGFHWTDGDESTIYITEGIAKSMAVHEVTGAKVFTAFGQLRLVACAKLARSIHPDAEIIVAGDMDDDPTRGPQKAQEAATAVGGVCVLPPNPDEDWDGILLGRGAEALADALRQVAEAEPVVEVADEWWNGWVYDTATDKYIRSTTFEALSKQGFDVANNRNLPPKTGSASRYVQDIIRTVHGVRYWPGKPEFFEWEGTTCLNRYRPNQLAMRPAETIAERSAVERMLSHARRLIPEAWEAEMFLDWLAFVIRNPGQRVNWAPVLVGVQGNGKSYWLALARAILGRNFGEVTGDIASDKYTDWAVGRQLIGVEEIRVHDKGRYAVLDRLKPFITNETVTVVGKYEKAHQAPNTASYIFTTNHTDAIPMDPNERRFMVISTSDDRPTGDYFKALFADIQAHAGVLAYELHHRKIGLEFNPKGHAPMTGGRDVMIEASKPAMTVEVEEAIARYECPVINGEIVDATLLAEKARLDRYPLPQTKAMNKCLKDLGYEPIGRHKTRGQNSNKRALWIMTLDGMSKEKALEIARSWLE